MTVEFPGSAVCGTNGAACCAKAPARRIPAVPAAAGRAGGRNVGTTPGNGVEGLTPLQWAGTLAIRRGCNQT